VQPAGRSHGDRKKEEKNSIRWPRGHISAAEMRECFISLIPPHSSGGPCGFFTSQAIPNFREENPPKGGQKRQEAGGRRQEALLRVVKWWQVLLFLVNLDHQDLLQKGKKKKIERKVSRNWEKKEAFTPVSSFSTESCPSLGGTVMVTRTHPSRASSIHAEVP